MENYIDVLISLSVGAGFGLLYHFLYKTNSGRKELWWLFLVGGAAGGFVGTFLVSVLLSLPTFDVGGELLKARFLIGGFVGATMTCIGIVKNN